MASVGLKTFLLPFKANKYFNGMKSKKKLQKKEWMDIFV